MNSYNSFDIFNLWGRPKFPNQRSTRSLDPDLLPNPQTFVYNLPLKIPLFMALETERKQRSLAILRLVPAPDCFALADLMAVAVVVAAAQGCTSGSWQM